MRLVNPVLRRELLERWRGGRAVATLTAFLGLLAIGLWGLARLGGLLLASRLRFDDGLVVAGPALGRFLFECCLTLVLTLVLFVSPGYAATQISGERDRRTLPLLQATLLRPSQIVLGKLGAATAWLVLLVTATVPLAAAGLFLGGIALVDLLRAVAFVLAVSVGIAGVAIGISSLTRRTTASIVLTYGFIVLLLLGSGIGAGVEAFLQARGPAGVTHAPYLLRLNAFYGLADAAGATPESAFTSLPSPLTAVAAALPEQFESDGLVGGVVTEQAVVLGDGVSRFGPAPLEVGPLGPLGDEPGAAGPSTWLVVAALHLVLGLAGLALATRRLGGRLPRRLRRLSWRARRRSGAVEPAA